MTSNQTVPLPAIGKRTGDNARRFLLDLAGRLVWPAPHESDAHAFRAGRYRTVTQLSSDAFAGHPEAVDLAFGPYVDYGQIIKDYRNVERNNLTIRTFMRRFTRLSLGFSKKLENLSAAVALHVAYFNFCWRPRMPGKSGRKRVTPAMAAKLIDKLWALEDLLGAL